jgi:hypothetical protein
VLEVTAPAAWAAAAGLETVPAAVLVVQVALVGPAVLVRELGAAA